MGVAGREGGAIRRGTLCPCEHGPKGDDAPPSQRHPARFGLLHPRFAGRRGSGAEGETNRLSRRSQQMRCQGIGDEFAAAPVEQADEDSRWIDLKQERA